LKAQVEARRRVPGAAFAKGIYGELKKVGWPSRQEATRLTGIVLVVTIVISLILWGVDTLFTRLVDILLLD